MSHSTTSGITKVLSLALLLFPTALFALSPEGEESVDWFTANSEYIVSGTLALILIVLLFAMFLMGDRLVRVSANKLGESTGKDPEDMERKYSVLPKLNLDAASSNVIKIKKGHTLHLAGVAKETVKPLNASTYSINPADFVGMSPIPKCEFEIGQEVKAGEIIFYDKKRPEIKYAAPVSGEVVEIIRGAKRKIEGIKILADKEVAFNEIGTANPTELSVEAIKERLIDNGGWPFIKQRPFNTVAEPNDKPNFVYISTFDTAPLAPNYGFVVKGQEAAFQAGVDALNKLTDGGVHLGLNAKCEHVSTFEGIGNTTKHYFEGPHPAGNVGIQLAHVAPIKKGDLVWTVRPQDVVIIGRLFTEGRLNTSKLVAVSGCEIAEPHYVSTYQGANVANMLKDNLKQDHVRVVSGNLLTGNNIGKEGYLGFSDDMISVIEEGDKVEFFGWLVPSYPRPSVSPTFLSYFFQGEPLDVNTNAHGEQRAFVVTGRYEEVLPMDIYPMQLCKAVLAQDYEKMEGLGLLEVEPEDLALCEFVCPSKQPIQHIVREGLELLRQG